MRLLFISNLAGTLVYRISNSLKANRGVRNFAWLVGDKGIRIIVGLFVGSWVARYLGTEQFGLLAYVLTWVAILGGVVSLGMDAIVVRRVIEAPERSSILLGTVMLFRMATSIIGGVVILTLVWGMRGGDLLVWELIGIMLVGILIQSLESYEIWFQASLKMRELVIPRLISYLVISSVKVLMVIRGAGLVGFVVLSAAELACGGVMTFVIYRINCRGRARGFFELSEGCSILMDSWPLAISGVVIVVYMKSSQLLLAGLLDDAALGIYAAALRVSEAPYFLPVIIASSILPTLLHARKSGDVVYRSERMRYFRISAAMGYGLTFFIVLGAPWIIKFLYGTRYSGADEVLIVLAGAIVFVFMGVARTQCLINEGLSVLSLRFIIWGLLVNVFLCLLLIPRFGPVGAAWAVFLGQSVAAVFSSFIYPASRSIGFEQISALFTPWKFLNR